jgi:hypothetical protein
MTEITTNIKTTSTHRLSQWLFNPFRVVAGYKALLLGLAIILISALVGSLSNPHFDGVLDVHTGTEAPLWLFFAEGLINWICMVVPLFFFGLIVSRSSFRVIDVLGTQALARSPYLITALVMLPNANRRFGVYVMSKLTQTASTATINYIDMLVFALAMILTILMAVWMVALMYRAYYISCNIKGAKATITFVVSLIGAEVLSKFAILRLAV